MEYKDFGKLLNKLRIKNGLTYETLAQKMQMKNNNITAKTIKKWEYDLAFPDLDELYKLSEIFQYPCEELLQSKTETLQSGLNGINKRIVRWISFTLGVSLYGAVVINYVFIFLLYVIAFLLFYNVLKR